MKVNVEKSQELAEQIDAQPKACWRNAIYAQGFVPDAFYVEGWAISAEGLVFEHGWLESDGEIIDPTLPDCQAYFAALRLCWEETRERITSGDRKLPLVLRYGRGGMGCVEYENAYKEAWNYYEREIKNQR